MEKRTLETVLRDIGEMVENRIPVGPEQWLQAAQFLNLFLEGETSKLYDLQHKVANNKLTFLESDPKRNVSQANLKSEATEDYRDMKKQEAKIEQIVEFIRISKMQARMANEAIRGN